MALEKTGCDLVLADKLLLMSAAFLQVWHPSGLSPKPRTAQAFV